MNRYNVGNIATNAVQTLSISGTAASGLIRRSKENAASALNAQRSKEFDDAKIAGMKADAKLKDAKANELQSKADKREADAELKQAKTENLQSLTRKRNAQMIADIGTPEANEVAKKIDADIEWQKYTLMGKEFEGRNVGGIIVPRNLGGNK